MLLGRNPWTYVYLQKTAEARGRVGKPAFPSPSDHRGPVSQHSGETARAQHGPKALPANAEWTEAAEPCATTAGARPQRPLSPSPAEDGGGGPAAVTTGDHHLSLPLNSPLLALQVPPPPPQQQHLGSERNIAHRQSKHTPRECTLKTGNGGQVCRKGPGRGADVSLGAEHPHFEDGLRKSTTCHSFKSQK